MWVAQTTVAPFSAGNMPPPASPPSENDGPVDLESNVGYIDSAVPMNQFRLRFDAAYDSNRPSRAEYFYAKPRLLGGKGPLFPERNVDYQELTGLLEMLAVDYIVRPDGAKYLLEVNHIPNVTLFPELRATYLHLDSA